MDTWGENKSNMVWIGDWKLTQSGRGEMDRAFGVEGSPKRLNGEGLMLVHSRRVIQIMEGRNAEEKEESEGLEDTEGWAGQWGEAPMELDLFLFFWQVLVECSPL